MNIQVRWIDWKKYAELVVTEGNVVLTTGVLNEAERKELALELAEACRDLQVEDHD
jgi:hypothetical protein